MVVGGVDDRDGRPGTGRVAEDDWTFVTNASQSLLIITHTRKRTANTNTNSAVGNASFQSNSWRLRAALLMKIALCERHPFD